jgi:TetR/AcrR family transcriptional repressor of nem operon
MARPREFDEDVALDRAMDVFWEQGYEATSTEDLMKAMGIGRGSFYNAFGSKRAVYLRTFDRYLAHLRESDLYRSLFAMKPGGEALRSVMAGYLESVASESGAHGCYFVHAAKEHRGEDPEVQAAIQRGIAAMKEVLIAHVKAAQGEGLLPAHLDPTRTALFMMAVVWGSHVMMEAGVAKDEAMAAAGTLFDMNAEPA